MQTMTATYSPDDNKLRLYSSSRLDSATYERVKAAGFKWAPRQELFVAPMWTPAREDLLLELCGEIGDEDTSLVERAEERADRFGDYSDKRASDAESARRAVSSIADGIPSVSRSWWGTTASAARARMPSGSRTACAVP
ncbi:Methyltransferase type 11 (fragment) (plasmid) [Denitratisoma oestradiolicum]|uniref:Methyltransferase type 11 n=1 Tax=Denitratisoma oestradiolicum TaxID=311182 RepID=A0A6S6Y439_9PROT